VCLEIEKRKRRDVSEKEQNRLKTLEWLAEFVMACPEDSIPVSRQQRLIGELGQLLNVTEIGAAHVRANFHLSFASAESRNANLKPRVFNELAAMDSQNGAFEKQ
jgi:hypothetical protein